MEAAFGSCSLGTLGTIEGSVARFLARKLRRISNELTATNQKVGSSNLSGRATNSPQIQSLASSPSPPILAAVPELSPFARAWLGHRDYVLLGGLQVVLRAPQSRPQISLGSDRVTPEHGVGLMPGDFHRDGLGNASTIAAGVAR